MKMTRSSSAKSAASPGSDSAETMSKMTLTDNRQAIVDMNMLTELLEVITLQLNCKENENYLIK